jgi:hypothetical protein
MSVGGVRRRLSESLTIVSDYVDRGRAAGRRAVHSLVVWLSWRRFDDRAQRFQLPPADQVLQMGIVAVMTVAATALLVTHHAPPAKVTHPRNPPRVAAVGSVPSGVTPAHVNTPTVAGPATATTVAHVPASVVAVDSLPVTAHLPVLPVTLPAVSIPPVVDAVVRHAPAL